MTICPSESSDDKINALYKYNNINKKVNNLLNRKNELLEKESRNKTLEKARKLLKKKLEFHKYWVKKLYDIHFYTDLILIFLVITLILYKLL
jgi:hypothetical protein